MWRGLMLTKAVEQFLRDVRWGELDYLLIDMPPGTGDVQMGLARMLPRTDLLIVTTPAVSAQKVAIRAADMARRSFLRVAGVIENMSAFTCDHGESYALFGTGGGQTLADEIGAPLLGQVPIEAAVAAGGDGGEPVSLAGDGAAAERVPGDRDAIVTETVPPVNMAGCSAPSSLLERRQSGPLGPEGRDELNRGSGRVVQLASLATTGTDRSTSAAELKQYSAYNDGTSSSVATEGDQGGDDRRPRPGSLEVRQAILEQVRVLRCAPTPDRPRRRRGRRRPGRARTAGAEQHERAEPADRGEDDQRQGTVGQPMEQRSARRRVARRSRRGRSRRRPPRRTIARRRK